MWLRNYLSNLKKSNKIVIYLVNPTAGLANSLRGISSTIYLSYFTNSNFFLKRWNSIIFYFDFPKILLTKNDKGISISYKRFNKNILGKINSNISGIILTDIHGFLQMLVKNYIETKKMNILMKIYSCNRITGRVLNSILYNEIFIPSKYINKYLKLFITKRERKKVLGVHIRSGIFDINNFTEHYFSKIKLSSYFEQIDMYIIKYNFSYIYAVSDNIFYLNQLRKHDINKHMNISIKGDITHSRFSLYNSKINNNAIRIVSEFIILSNCDAIIGTKMSSYSSESCYYKKKIFCLFI